jgi:hypothetical protein
MLPQMPHSFPFNPLQSQPSDLNNLLSQISQLQAISNDLSNPSSSSGSRNPTNFPPFFTPFGNLPTMMDSTMQQPAATSLEPPEVRFESQLEALKEMGFTVRVL